MAATATTTEKTTTAKAEPIPAKGTALAKAPEARITGAYHDAALADERLRQAAGKAHLVSPATVVGALPPGCSVAIAQVFVDKAHETYDVGGGKVGLAKSALDRIGHAAGVSWDPHLSRRMDDGSDPHYCHWKAVGTYRRFDGTECQIVAEKEMDLRPGSPQCVALELRAKKKGKSAEQQIREMRLHILGHAETKARLRAIRALGIRTSYEPDELSRPFVVARLMWTGQSDDPELRKLFALKQADAMLGGVRSLYGAGATDPAPLPPPRPMLPAAHVPPPVAAARTVDADDDVPDFDDVPETPSEPSARPAARAGKPASFRFGKAKGKTFAEGTDRDLEWYGEALAKSVEDPEKADYREGNERDLAALRAEQERRAKARPIDRANGEVDDSEIPDHVGREPGDESEEQGAGQRGLKL